MIKPEDILGTWYLVGATDIHEGRPVDRTPLGEKPEGVVHYLPDGRVAVLIAHDGRKPISNGNRRAGPLDEMAAAAASFDAYAGRWELTGEAEITHFLDLCSFENDRSAPYVRRISWNGDNLVLTTPEALHNGIRRCMALEWARRPG